MKGTGPGREANALLAEDKNNIPTRDTSDEQLLQSTHDMLWITSQLIEQALPPTSEHVRDSLLRLLGPQVFSKLDAGARHTLIEAERIFRQSLNPMACIREIAQAFEEHVRARIVPLFQGLFGRHRNPSLNDIQQVLEGCSQGVRDSLNRAGLDPAAVADAIKRVRRCHADWKHYPNKARLCREEVREIRETWYGLKPGEPGVFHLITGGPRAPAP